MATTPGFQRIPLVKNTHYKRSGLKSYAYALQKCVYERETLSFRTSLARGLPPFASIKGVSLHQRKPLHKICIKPTGHQLYFLLYS